jgi:phosphatidyl-myo-inositol alpha-mannosyltransferase
MERPFPAGANRAAMSLRIGIVTEYYYPLLGGISENVHNSARRLRKLGHTVKIVTSNPGNGWQPTPADGSSVIRIGRSASIYSNGSMARLALGARLFHEMQALLRRESFDLLHLHSPLVPTLPMFALFAAQCPTVGTFHTYFDKSFWYSLLKEKVQRKLIDKLSGQIAVSQSCIDALSRFFNVKARIIPNGVDTAVFSPDVPKLDAYRDGKKNLLFLGRLDPRNGVSLMLRTFGYVKERRSDVRLIIVGDGPLRKYYRRLIPESLQEDVHLAGPVLGERNRYYASCDVFCSPVDKASFGVTLLEAMASGKPIVATENRGYREILSPAEGFLVPPKEPEVFGDAILKLLDSPELRAEMGANGRYKAERYSWDIVTGEIAAFYSEVLNRR